MWSATSRPTLGAVLLLAAAACQSDPCEKDGAGLQLQLVVPDLSLALQATAVHVELRVGSDGWEKDIPLGSQLEDGSTSVALLLDPALDAPFTIDVRVLLRDGTGATRASGSAQQELQPNGCNTVSITLSPGQPDGGVNDAGANDIGANDTGADDAGSGDTGDNDAGVNDAGSMDAQVFGYAPFNFDPNSVAPSGGLSIATNPCTVVYNTSSAPPSFSQTCGLLNLPTGVVASSGGVELVILPVTSLSVGAGSTFSAVGTRPLLLAVYGDANINGSINVSAARDVPGAGGSNATLCTQGSAELHGSATAAGGGGGGGFASNGGAGGAGAGGTGAGGNGLSEANTSLVPLRGGCGGGRGSNNSDPGGGGGGLQISAAGTLTLAGGGRLLAGGGAGRNNGEGDGGGGGGSGGGLLLEADRLLLSGSLYANGGGGGGGGSAANEGDDGQNGDRADPAGGGGGSGGGGRGGRGTGTMTSSTAISGANATAAGAGGGGGGGGSGVIRLHGVSQCTFTGTVLPAPTNSPGC